MYKEFGWILRSVMEPQSLYYVYFRTNTLGERYELLYQHPHVMDQIVSLLLFNKNDFGIK